MDCRPLVQPYEPVYQLVLYMAPGELIHITVLALTRITAALSTGNKSVDHS